MAGSYERSKQHKSVAAKKAGGGNGRKEKRKEERRDAKDARKGRERRFKDKSHDTEGRRHQLKQRLEAERLGRALEAQEQVVRSYQPPAQKESLHPELKRKRRRRDFYDLDTSDWQLRGAARPAAALAAAAAEFEKSPTRGPTGQDLWSENEGNFFEANAHTAQYLEVRVQLARVLHRELGKLREAATHYRACLQLDTKDALKCRRGLVQCLLGSMKKGEAEAREVMERFPSDESTVFLWSKAAIAFVSWKRWKKDGHTEGTAGVALRRAMCANPYVGWILALESAFPPNVDTESIWEETLCAGELQQDAFEYLHRDITGLWQCIDGADLWCRKYIEQEGTPPPEGLGDPFLNVSSTQIDESSVEFVARFFSLLEEESANGSD